MGARVVVAGIGNVFLGDDAFGVEVARRLGDESLGPAVQVVDAGIRALHLAYTLLEQPELLIVIDAVRRGDAPGTVSLIRPIDVETMVPAAPDAHAMNLGAVVAALRALGGTPPPILLVACEAESVEERIGLSPAVEQALPRAEEMIRTTVKHHLVHAVPRAAEGVSDE